MTLWLIVDNASPVPDRLRELIGIESFGQLIYKRQTVSSIMEHAARAASLPAPVMVGTIDDWAALDSQVRRRDRSDDRFLVCPAGIICGRGADVLAHFLQQARYSPQNLTLPIPGETDWSGWILMMEPVFRGYLAARAQNNIVPYLDGKREHFVRLDERLQLINLDDEVTLLEFLSGTFDARFFNSIERDNYTVTKRSTDKAKLEREYRFWELLPPPMQMFFIRPFGFIDEGATASYRMERLFIPDVAVQWLHNAFNEAEFRRLMSHFFYFISTRAQRSARAGEVEIATEALYITKVQERLDALKKVPQYKDLEPLFEQACGGIDALFDRYKVIFKDLRSELAGNRLVIGHGDFCFSNILYTKTSQSLKLIDPKGATEEADLWTHPFYDLAKLSHSVLGAYDFVNHDLFEIQIDDDLHPQLVIDRPRPEWARPIFEDALTSAGYSLKAVRLCEASLFISMLPLHIDRPRKVLAFVLIAVEILNELEGRP